jgi:hypothetical protein
MNREIVNGLNDAVRDNPLAAGLIGAGVVWMLFGKVTPPALGGIAGSLKGTAGTIAAAAEQSGESVAWRLGNVGSRIAETASQVKESAHDALSTLAPSEVPGIVAEAGESVMAGVRASAEAGRRYGSSLQQTLSENLERQPLLLGVIGLAIGAGLASAFATTKFEGELMGEQGEAAREKLQTLAEEAEQFATTRATEVLDAVKDEAASQGLTPAAARETFDELSRKAKNVAGSAKDAVTSRASEAADTRPMPR